MSDDPESLRFVADAAAAFVGARNRWHEEARRSDALPAVEFTRAYDDALDALVDAVRQLDVSSNMGGAAPGEAAPRPEVSQGPSVGDAGHQDEDPRSSASGVETKSGAAPGVGWRGFASTFDLTGETIMGTPLIDVDETLGDASHQDEAPRSVRAGKFADLPRKAAHTQQRPGSQYMSNACIHDNHAQCDEECGICHDGCACDCHPWNVDSDDDTP